jgi:hypothetical protein
MLTQGLPFGRHIGVFSFGSVKFSSTKWRRSKLAWFLHPVIGKDHQRIAVRNGVSERFLIGKQFRALHIIKQRTEQDIG